MPNVNDYLDWRGDISFSEVKPNEVDALIFSNIVYVNFEGIIDASDNAITLKEAAGRYVEKYPNSKDRHLGLLLLPEIVDLFIKAAGTKRFGEVKAFKYVNEICESCEMQFSAMSFLLPDGGTFTAFRGTDDTIFGWKEDFKLSFCDEVSSHKSAVSYLNSIKAGHKKIKNIYVTGHSKGGHLAVWASVFSEPRIRDRIAHIYSNDGPGFLPSVIESQEYKEMSDRITAIIPQSSLVGLLLDSNRTFQIVKSRKNGIMQHNPLLWEVMGGMFVRMPQLSPQGLRNDTILRAKVASLTPEDRQRLTEIVFDILNATGAKTLSELNESKIKNAIAVIKAVNDLDRKEREVLSMVLSLLLNFKIPKAKKEQKEAAELEDDSASAEMTLDVKFFPFITENPKKNRSEKRKNE